MFRARFLKELGVVEMFREGVAGNKKEEQQEMVTSCMIANVDESKRAKWFISFDFACVAEKGQRLFGMAFVSPRTRHLRLLFRTEH
jgi:hypothetical protein